jgi:hypothetical protein
VLNFAELAENLVQEQAALLEAPTAEAIQHARHMASQMAEQLGKVREHAERIEEVLASMLADSGDPGQPAR